MVLQSTPAVAVPASWWQRLLVAERQTLAAGLVDDEREIWLAVDGAAAFEPAPGVLALAQRGRHLEGDLRAIESQWPLRDDSIDRVVLQHVLEAGGRIEELLDESIRVLKPERGIALFVVGALGWTRCKLRFGDCGAPPLRVRSTRALLEALAVRGCVDLRVSQVDFDGLAEVRIAAPARIWSGLCLIEARKRRELPNVRQLRARSRAATPVSGWVARPTSRSGLAA
ncbi:MAG: methyltransferase domain-containing protein [Xanthomonadales bacterium]|nr:methyltransferase domain-containing protein [Xanthomonadales bacterium]MBK7146812.1 methyltransferase domain-containing protein [Xanthomonadales bacterium]MCC6561534.1 methyltransferase domain-containing protein [Xanthomonadales bacterium]